MEHLYHFNLTQDPFQNEPDLRFFFESETHRRAQLRIDRALRQSKGLVLLTGEGGTGKSLLARRIFEGLEEEVFESALMVMMQGTADATSVLRRFASQLGVEEPPMERAPLIGMLYEQLAIVREDGRHVALILDDAHALGRDAMAEIGGLMNLEYEDRRLLSLLLVGLPDLDAMVAEIPSLGERVDVRVPLQALSEPDAQAYIAHRIQAAGGDAVIMDEAATQNVFKLGSGRPRRMNALADNALFEAYLGGRATVGAEDVETAGRDLAFEAGSASTPQVISQPQPPTESVSAPAPKTPAAGSEPFDAATELSMEPVASVDVQSSMDELDLMGETMGAHSSPEPADAFEFESSPSTAGPPSGMAEATMLMDDFAEPAAEPAGDVDLASLLDTGSDDTALEFDLGEPVAEAVLREEPEKAFPSFSAENSAAPTAEATRIALPDDLDGEDSFSASLELGETTDSDEIDDLFVELLDD